MNEFYVIEILADSGNLVDLCLGSKCLTGLRSADALRFVSTDVAETHRLKLENPIAYKVTKQSLESYK